MANARYGFVIDTTSCIGCHTCAVACKGENGLPDDIWWNRVLTKDSNTMDNSSGIFPILNLAYITLACQHCENPACVKACPVGATYKDSETGAVRQDNDRCIGCRMCMSACPYTGVRSFNWDAPRFSSGFATGDIDVPAHQKHTVEKCTMCWHRMARDEDPECVSACVGRARFWGDLNDPNSEVSKLIASREYMQLLPEEGTNPSVYYLV